MAEGLWVVAAQTRLKRKREELAHAQVQLEAKRLADEAQHKETLRNSATFLEALGALKAMTEGLALEADIGESCWLEIRRRHLSGSTLAYARSYGRTIPMRSAVFRHDQSHQLSADAELGEERELLAADFCEWAIKIGLAAKAARVGACYVPVPFSTSDGLIPQGLVDPDDIHNMPRGLLDGDYIIVVKIE